MTEDDDVGEIDIERIKRRTDTELFGGAFDNIRLFDAMYGAGSYAFAQQLIGALAPNTRRDDWWGTMGPYEIIGRLLRDHGRQL